ncbi:hypothetical protein KBD08_00255 [Candidatus Babeliales bacterium]|nr:hypothetical protein [Candidatus Babeliales bacterium]
MIPSIQDSMVKIEQTSKPHTVELWFFKNNTWHTETTDIIKNNKATTIQQILNYWFTLMEDEQLYEKHTIIQSVALNHNASEAFISFNQNPLQNHASIYSNYFLIHGILKTLKANNLELQSVRFLVNHQPIQDGQFNFDHSWNINGYINLVN